MACRLPRLVPTLPCIQLQLIIALLLLLQYLSIDASEPQCSQTIDVGQQFPKQQSLFDPKNGAQSCDRKIDDDLKFPDTFQFGASSSAHQIEGAWKEDGRTPDIWDDMIHQHPELFMGNDSSDVGTDSYHQYGQDIDALKTVGFDFYRLSISWSRVMPDAIHPNEIGLQYYDKVIDALLADNIQPIVTIFHLDTPACLQKFGGWTNSAILPYFQQYARMLFERYGDRVRTWITINEPSAFCLIGHNDDYWAPQITGAAHGTGYMCGDNMLKAHATVYRMYRREFYARQGGKLGMAYDTNYFFDTDTYDAEHPRPVSVLVDRAMQFEVGWLMHPIFTAGGYYSSVVVDAVAANSARHGLPHTQLPQLTPEWSEVIRGSADFLAINYYVSYMVEPIKPGDYDNATETSAEEDRAYYTSHREEWPHGSAIWHYSVPRGMGDILRWIREEYNNPEVIITENGWSDRGEQQDYGRIEYLRDHLREVQLAVVRDGCNVTGYSVWSLFDNFEWTAGFTQNFGLFSVDLKSADKKRSPKLSASYMRRVIQSRMVPEN